MPTPTAPRFVNLNSTRAHVSGPDGQQVIVHPFRDTLVAKTCRSDAVYVLEGEWWRQFVGDRGPLFPFPAPREYGLTSFPALSGSNIRRLASAVDLRAQGASGSAVAAAASAGRYRATGDVITAEGKIRRTLPDGSEVLLEDVPENRLVIHTDIAAGRAVPIPTEERNVMLKRSIIDTLEEMGVDSYIKFAELSDERMLAIPGINSQNLPMLRKNIGDLLKRLDADAREEGEALGDAPTPEGSTPGTDPRPQAQQPPSTAGDESRKPKRATRRGSKAKAHPATD